MYESGYKKKLEYHPTDQLQWGLAICVTKSMLPSSALLLLALKLKTAVEQSTSKRILGYGAGLVESW